jgi:hypothetical protein
MLSCTGAVHQHSFKLHVLSLASAACWHHSPTGAPGPSSSSQQRPKRTSQRRLESQLASPLLDDSPGVGAADGAFFTPPGSFDEPAVAAGAGAGAGTAEEEPAAADEEDVEAPAAAAGGSGGGAGVGSSQRTRGSQQTQQAAAKASQGSQKRSNKAAGAAVTTSGGRGGSAKGGEAAAAAAGSGGRRRGGVSKPRVSGSVKAGLAFPVARVRRQLKGRLIKARLGAGGWWSTVVVRGCMLALSSQLGLQALVKRLDGVRALWLTMWSHSPLLSAGLVWVVLHTGAVILCMQPLVTLPCLG